MSGMATVMVTDNDVTLTLISAIQGDIDALTALYEPFGLAPLEAMAAGLPAVVSKFVGPSAS